MKSKKQTIASVFMILCFVFVTTIGIIPVGVQGIAHADATSASIPPGCPGSTQQGPKPVGFVCPTPTATTGTYYCGSGKNAVQTAINIGCKGQSCQSSDPNGCSAVLDAAFAVIRFLSDGAGLILVLGLIIAGIQFTASKGDPQLRAKALSRVYHVVIAMFVFVFAYAILNYLVPAGFFK